MEITGIIKAIGGIEQVSDKFKKRDLVITTEEQYPQHVALQATQDYCHVLDAYREGQKVTAHFNVRGREWTSPQGEVKYFNTLQVWRIDAVQSAAPAQAQAAAPATQADPHAPQASGLPF